MVNTLLTTIFNVVPTRTGKKSCIDATDTFKIKSQMIILAYANDVAVTTKSERELKKECRGIPMSTTRRINNRKRN